MTLALRFHSKGLPSYADEVREKENTVSHGRGGSENFGTITPEVDGSIQK